MTLGYLIAGSLIISRLPSTERTPPRIGVSAWMDLHPKYDSRSILATTVYSTSQFTVLPTPEVMK